MDIAISVPFESPDTPATTKLHRIKLTRCQLLKAVLFDPQQNPPQEGDPDAHIVEELAALETLADFGKYCCYLALKKEAEDSQHGVTDDNELRESAVELAELLCLMLPGGVEAGSGSGAGGGGSAPSFASPAQPSVVLDGIGDNDGENGGAAAAGSQSRCLYAPNVVPIEIQNQQLWRHVLMAASSSGVISIVYPHFSFAPWRKVINPIADLVVLFNTWNAQIEAKAKTGATATGGTHLLGPTLASTTASPLNTLGPSFASPASGSKQRPTDGSQHDISVLLNAAGGGGIGAMEDLGASGGRKSAVVVAPLLPPPEVQTLSKAQVDEANKVLLFFEGRLKDSAIAAAAQGQGAPAPPQPSDLQLQDADILNTVSPYTSSSHNASHSHRTASNTALRVSVPPELLCSVCCRIPHTVALCYMACCGAFGCRRCLAVPVEQAGGGGAGESSNSPSLAVNGPDGKALPVKFRCGACDESMKGVPSNNNATAAAGPAATAPAVTVTVGNSPTNNNVDAEKDGQQQQQQQQQQPQFEPEHLRAAPGQAAKIALAVKAFLVAHCKDKESGILGAAGLSGGMSGSALGGTGLGGRPALAPPPGFTQAPPGFTSRSYPGSPMGILGGGGGGGGGPPHSPGVLASPRVPPAGFSTSSPIISHKPTPTATGTVAGSGGFRMLPKTTTTPSSVTSTAAPTPSSGGVVGAKDTAPRAPSGEEPAATKRRLE